jgi:hypothetical protein
MKRNMSPRNLHNIRPAARSGCRRFVARRGLRFGGRPEFAVPAVDPKAIVAGIGRAMQRLLNQSTVRRMLAAFRSRGFVIGQYEEPDVVMLTHKIV